jgi:hypothetical protein
MYDIVARVAEAKIREAMENGDKKVNARIHRVLQLSMPL